jgi:CRP/FNR family transcriptional regulator, cyclic AMP receptor protein
VLIPDLAPPSRDDVPIRVQLTLNHEEIAEMAGSSRETVTRPFASFKKDNLIEIHGSTLIIKDAHSLRDLIEE